MDTQNSERDASRSTSETTNKDCLQCKLVGAGGCFGASLYALYQRGKAPSVRNKFVLGVVALVAGGLGVVRIFT